MSMQRPRGFGCSSGAPWRHARHVVLVEYAIDLMLSPTKKVVEVREPRCVVSPHGHRDGIRQWQAAVAGRRHEPRLQRLWGASGKESGERSPYHGNIDVAVGNRGDNLRWRAV